MEKEKDGHRRRPPDLEQPLSRLAWWSPETLLEVREQLAAGAPEWLRESQRALVRLADKWVPGGARTDTSRPRFLDWGGS